MKREKISQNTQTTEKQKQKKNPQKVPVNLMTGNKNTDDRNLIE